MTPKFVQFPPERKADWFEYEHNPGWYRQAVAYDAPDRLNFDMTQPRKVVRHACNSGGTPIYSLYIGDTEVMTTLFSPVAEEWIKLTK